MRTIHTSGRNPAAIRQTGLVCALLITLALLVPLRNAFTASATSAPAESTIVLDTAGAPFLQGISQAVNNGPGNQNWAHVDCDVASYSNDDFEGFSTIHYQNLSTAADHIVPGNQVDILSDVSGSRIAFTEASLSGDTVRVFDTSSQTITVVPGFGFSNPSIGGNLVAFEDRNSWDQGQITTYDLSTGVVTRLTNDSLSNGGADVSPNGKAVVWQQCQTPFLDCDIYAAIQTSPGVFTTRALTTGGGNDLFPSTNGEIAVYESNRTGENDIYYQPLASGTEVHLAIPGDQRLPTISGDLISFESGDSQRGGYEIFVYDIRSGKLFQVTNTLGFDEQLNEISVCGDVGRIVYGIPGDGFDAYAFTFQVPSVNENQIDDLISQVRSFNLQPGIANSLIRKLQNALDAIDAGDTATACSSLNAFINECQAQSGKKLTAQQAAQLITAASQIKTGLGCQ
ncbi:MAG TPA: hypothetical protein VL866_12505 [Pyrinomonadaceae bacterium]|nr:hypothetical protein [Pyrinomonadaceae bacterium]